MAKNIIIIIISSSSSSSNRGKPRGPRRVDRGPEAGIASVTPVSIHVIIHVYLFYYFYYY